MTDIIRFHDGINGCAINDNSWVMKINGDINISGISLISLFKDEKYYWSNIKSFRDWFDDNKDMFGATIYLYDNKYKLLGLFGNILKTTNPRNIFVNQMRVLMYKRLMSETITEPCRQGGESVDEFRVRCVEREANPVYNRKYCTFHDVSGFSNKRLDDIGDLYKFIIDMDLFYTHCGTRMKLTPAGCGYNIMKDSNYLLNNIIVSDDEDELFRSAVYGGRNEIYVSRDCREDLYYYDINSLYPYILSTINIPDPEMLLYKPVDAFDNIIKTEEGMAGITINVPEMDIPPLPFSVEEKTIYPTGVISGTWCFPEIRMALSQGCEIVDVHNIISAPAIEMPFKGFATAMDLKRKEYKADGDDVMAGLVKKTMNFSIGKLGQRFEIEPSTVWFDPFKLDGREFEMLQNGMVHLTDIPMVRAKHTCVSAYAYILSESKVLMNSFNKYGGEKYYTDTDSLVCSEAMPNKFVGAEMGKFKLEYEIERSYFKMPKFYMFNDAKGVHRITAGLAHNEKLSYSGLNGTVIDMPGLLPNGRGGYVGTEFSINLEYNGRDVDHNGTTTPIHV